MSEYQIDWDKYLKDGAVVGALKIADRIEEGKDIPLDEIGRLMGKLSGYAIHIGWAAGIYKGERAKVQYEKQCSTEGTGIEKEAQGKKESAELRIKEEAMERIYKAIIKAAERLDTIYRERKKDYRQSRGFGDVPES